MPVANAIISIGAEVADTIVVGVQLVDSTGTNVVGLHGLDMWLAEEGSSYFPCAVSNFVAPPSVSTAGNILLLDNPNVVITAITNASGFIDLSIQDEFARNYNLLVRLPTSEVVISNLISFT